jgi:hypothetical protein
MYDYKNLQELLNKVTGVAVMDLLDKTSLIEEFAENMVPLQEGLYSNTTHKMVFSHKTSQYYALDEAGNKTKLVTLKDFQRCKLTIINEANGFIQKPDLRSLTIRRNLVETPIVDYRRMDIVEKIIDDFLYGLCPHTKTTMNSYPLDKLLKPNLPEEKRERLINNLESMLVTVIDEISQFVGSDTWHFYFTKRKGSSIIINKTVDFRIFDWYRIKWAHEEPDTDSQATADIYSIFAPS